MTTQLTELLAEMEAREKFLKVRINDKYYYGALLEVQFIIEKLKQLITDSTSNAHPPNYKSKP